MSGPRPNRFGTGLALLVAAACALGLAVPAGTLPQSAAAVGGALGLSWAVARPDDATPRRRALASVLGVGGVGALVLGTAYTHPFAGTGVVLCGALAVVALGLSSGPRSLVDSRFPEVVRSSMLVAAVVVGLAALARPASVVVAVEWASWAAAAVTATSFYALIALEAAVLAMLLLFPPTASVLERWFPGRSPEATRALANLGLDGGDLRETSRGLVVAAVAQVYLALGVPGLLDWLLAQLSILGAAVAFALRSGLVLVVPLVGCLACLVVLGGRALQRVAVRFGGEDPPGAAADAAGAVVVPLVGGAALFVRPSTAGLGALPGLLGHVGTVALSVLVCLFGVAVAWNLLADSAEAAPAGVSGHGVAAFALGLAVLAVAEGDGSALAVFAGLVGVVLVWDVGEYAATLGRELPGVDGRQGVLAHATASVLVGAGAVALALVAVYVLGPVASVPADAGTVALALALVAIAALAAAETRA